MNIPLKKHQAEWLATREKLQARLRQGEEDLLHGRIIVADDAFWDDINARIDRVAADQLRDTSLRAEGP